MLADFRTILRDVGILLHIPGVMALLSLPICLLAEEFYAVGPFLATAIAALVCGQLLYRGFQRAEMARLRQSLMTVAVGWLLVPLFGAIPFFLMAQQFSGIAEAPLSLLVFQDPWNALFESFSGFTSTGLSVALRPSYLPHSLQWWRSFTEWIGGVGVIVLMITVLQPSTDAYQLYSAEGRNQRIGLTVRKTVQRIWWIYLLYTALSILWLHVIGMPWWDALNHGLTGISTGGFSVKDESIGAYSPWVQLGVVPVMILGTMSFPLHYQLLQKRRWKALWQSTQHRALWVLLVVGTLLLMLENYWTYGEPAWIDSIFQWSSALGTCGFNTVTIRTWSVAAKLLLSLAMIIGGAAGSTAGGLKLNRASALYQGILWRFKRVSLAPHQIMRYRLNGKVLDEDEAYRRLESAAVLAVLWFVLIGFGVFFLSHLLPNWSLENIIFEAASALGSVGLSTGITAPSLVWQVKLIFILFMWMGRLEVVPVLLLISWPLGLARRKIIRRSRQ